MKKSLISVALGILLFTSNAHAGIPVVDGTSIQQSITNFIQNMNQNLKDYAIQAKNYALKAKEFIQEQTKGVNDIIGQVNEGVNWLAEQEVYLRNRLQEEVNGILDPITGEIKNKTIGEFTDLLKDGEEYYKKLVGALNKTEDAYNDVNAALVSLKDNPKNIEQLKKLQDLFGEIDIQKYEQECVVLGTPVRSCALKWGNRLAYVEGLQQVENNLKSIEAMSKHGLVKVASDESTIRRTVANATGGILGKITTRTEEKKGTTEKQQLEANNIIAAAEVAAQKQAVVAQQIENDYKKREEKLLYDETREKYIIKAGYRLNLEEQRVEKIKKDTEYVQQKIYGK